MNHPKQKDQGRDALRASLESPSQGKNALRASPKNSIQGKNALSASPHISASGKDALRASLTSLFQLTMRSLRPKTSVLRPPPCRKPPPREALNKAKFSIFEFLRR